MKNESKDIQTNMKHMKKQVTCLSTSWFCWISAPWSKTSPQVAILVTCANLAGLTFKQALQRETKFCLNENFRHVTRLVNSTYVLPVTAKHRNVFMSFIAGQGASTGKLGQVVDLSGSGKNLLIYWKYQIIKIYSENSWTPLKKTVQWRGVTSWDSESFCSAKAVFLFFLHGVCPC